MNDSLRMHEETESPKVRIPFVMALANKILATLKFVDFINRSIDYDEKQWKVSPGNLAKAVVLATFFDVRAPLSRISKFYETYDTEYLFGKGVKPEHLNDDAIGRMLDRLSDAKPNKLYGALCLSAYTIYKIFFKRLHTDTTSVSLFGDYETEEEERIIDGAVDKLGVKDGQARSQPHIKKGYNKDHRRDCKQLLYGKVVSEHGVPISGFAMDGNTSDSIWNRELIKHLKSNYQQMISEGIYIADSKMTNQEMIKELTDPENPISFISRCPSNFYEKIEDKTKERAYEKDDWTDVGKFGKGKKACEYSACEFSTRILGRQLRLIVVKSSEGHKRFAVKRDKLRDELAADIAKVEKKTFECKKDSEKEWQRFLKEHKDAVYECSVEHEETRIVKRRRGRPAKNAKPLSVKHIWKMNIKIGKKNDENMKRLQRKEESFVLITNVGVDKHDMRDIISFYKDQTVVETQFRFFKEPCLASVIYLKTPGRINALIMLLGVSLLLRGLMQYKMRKGYAKAVRDNVTLPKVGWNGAKLQPSLTAKFLFYALKNAYFIRQDVDYYTYCLPDRQRVLTLLYLMDLEITDLL